MKNYIFARFRPNRRHRSFVIVIVGSVSPAFFYTHIHTYFCCVLFISLRPFHFHFSTRSPLRIFSIWSSSFVVVRRCVPISQNSYNNRSRVVVCYCVWLYLHFSSSVSSFPLLHYYYDFCCSRSIFRFRCYSYKGSFFMDKRNETDLLLLRIVYFFPFSAFRYIFSSKKKFIQLSIFLLTA